MGFQSKTYSLSDEVVAAIEAGRERDGSPNRFLRRVLNLDSADVDHRVELDQRSKQAARNIAANHGKPREKGKQKP